jgi:hypothetical protein
MTSALGQERKEVLRQQAALAEQNQELEQALTELRAATAAREQLAESRPVGGLLSCPEHLSSARSPTGRTRAACAPGCSLGRAGSLVFNRLPDAYALTEAALLCARRGFDMAGLYYEDSRRRSIQNLEHSIAIGTFYAALQAALEFSGQQLDGWRGMGEVTYQVGAGAGFWIGEVAIRNEGEALRVGPTVQRFADARQQPFVGAVLVETLIAAGYAPGAYALALGFAIPNTEIVRESSDSEKLIVAEETRQTLKKHLQGQRWQITRTDARGRAAHWTLRVQHLLPQAQSVCTFIAWSKAPRISWPNPSTWMASWQWSSAIVRWR